MAYPAVVSLERTINRLLCSPFRISFVFPSTEILASALKTVRSLRNCLEQSERKRITNHFERRISGESEREKALAGKVREAAWELEDVLESTVSTQILSQFETYSLMPFSIDLEELSQVFYCFSETAKQMMEDMEDLDDDPSLQLEDDDEEVSILTSFGGNLPEMVGFTDVYDSIRNALAKQSFGFRILVVAGMAGSGKTTLAQKIFEDPRMKENFECCIFVSECRKSRPKKIMRAVIAQLNPDIDIDIDDKMVSEQQAEEEYHEFFLRSLNDDRKYLIVLDDLWDHHFLRNLQVSSLRESCNGTTILVTTRIRPNAAFHSSEDTFDLRFMDEEESWDLLREKVFGKEGCPPQLEKTGKRIAENCEGLPLLIITVANLLSNAEKTLEHWVKVAADKQNAVFEEAYDQILEANSCYGEIITLN